MQNSNLFAKLISGMYLKTVRGAGHQGPGMRLWITDYKFLFCLMPTVNRQLGSGEEGPPSIKLQTVKKNYQIFKDPTQSRMNL